MRKEGIYKIDDLTIINPIIEIKRVSDDLFTKTCAVELIFTIDGHIINYSRQIYGFTYTDTWEDSDIESWVSEELESYKI